MPDNFEPLLTELDAAEALTISVRTLQAWRRYGTGPDYHRIGRSVRYRPADLAAFVEAGRQRAS